MDRSDLSVDVLEPTPAVPAEQSESRMRDTEKKPPRRPPSQAEAPANQPAGGSGKPEDADKVQHQVDKLA